jgi:hypothetical protein
VEDILHGSRTMGASWRWVAEGKEAMEADLEREDIVQG